MIKALEKGEGTVLNLLGLIDQVIEDTHPAEAANLLPELVTATSKLIEVLNR